MTRRVSSWLAAVLMLMVTAVVAGRGQTAGDTPLVTAARGGDLPGIQPLLAKRADVNAPSRDGSTALLWDVYNGNLEMVRALFAAQAKVDVPNRFGVTPLLQASRTGDAAIIAALGEEHFPLTTERLADVVVEIREHQRCDRGRRCEESRADKLERYA